jgi:hypothetical protein
MREIEIDSDRMVMVAMVLLALIERKKSSSARSTLTPAPKFFRSRLMRFPYENFIVAGDLSFFLQKESSRREQKLSLQFTAMFLGIESFPRNA